MAEIIIGRPIVFSEKDKNKENFVAPLPTTIFIRTVDDSVIKIGAAEEEVLGVCLVPLLLVWVDVRSLFMVAAVDLHTE